MVGILVREHITKKIKEQNLLENYDSKCLQPASYELRVGNYYDRQTDSQIDLAKGEEIAIRPLGFLLLGTVERVNLPNDIIGMLYLRSTYARRGFVSYFQGIVDPGYQGSLTVMLHNLASEPLRIEGEERICHLVFEQLPQPVEQGYKGIYQGSPGATPSRYPSVMRVVGDPISNLPK